MFSAWLAELFKKAFTPLPDEPIHEWAEKNVYILKKHGAEEGWYRSSKTPWARWLQDIGRKPWRIRRGRRVRIRRIRIKKCTQSGFTEAILNIIRWRAKHRPGNFVYAINSKEEATNIRERLVDTLGRLGEDIFDGELGDLAKYTLRLREMIGWFLGSYSEGAFNNKFAVIGVCDEYDDHSPLKGHADTLALVEERLKTAEEDGLSIALSKPKFVNGPIHRAHAEGDQFEWFVPCPHCETYQPLEWDRVRFGHCKMHSGHWDTERVLSETWYQCASDAGCQIEESHKEWMEQRGRWLLAALGKDPETVSLHMSDLHSMMAGSSWGHLAREFIHATEEARRGNLQPLQMFKNGRLGEGMEQRAEKFALTDVLRCRSNYRRGFIPHAGLVLIIGFDVGLYVNTRFTVLAVNPVTVEAWVIDYGQSNGPADLLNLMQRTYPCPATGKSQGIVFAFPDMRYRREEVLAVAKQMPKRIWPTYGIKAESSLRAISFTQIPGEAPGFGAIMFIEADAKHHLYLRRIKEQMPPRLHFPEDAEESYLVEFTHEKLLVDPITGALRWAEKPTGPNHNGDTVKIALTGYDYLIDGPRSRAAAALDHSTPPEAAQLLA